MRSGRVDHGPRWRCPFDPPSEPGGGGDRIAGIGADAETIAKSETVADSKIAARDARPRSDVVRCHRGEVAGLR